jgi:hypothetical protein
MPTSAQPVALRARTLLITMSTMLKPDLFKVQKSGPTSIDSTHQTNINMGLELPPILSVPCSNHYIQLIILTIYQSDEKDSLFLRFPAESITITSCARTSNFRTRGHRRRPIDSNLRRDLIQPKRLPDRSRNGFDGDLSRHTILLSLGGPSNAGSHYSTSRLGRAESVRH